MLFHSILFHVRFHYFITFKIVHIYWNRLRIILLKSKKFVLNVPVLLMVSSHHLDILKIIPLYMTKLGSFKFPVDNWWISTFKSFQSGDFLPPGKININSVFIQSNTVFCQLRLISDCLNDKSYKCYKLISTLGMSVHIASMDKKFPG